MPEHIPVPYGYFKSQESRFFQAVKWAITGPDHDHEESWDIIADGIPDEATARFIVTACNCHADLLEALKAFIEFEDISNHWFFEGTLEEAQEQYQVALSKANEAIRKAEERII